jgi:hypothetical protein
MNNNEKKFDISDLKIRILIISLTSIILISLFTFINSPWPKERPTTVPYCWGGAKVVDENGKQIRGIPVSDDLTIENVSITLINVTSMVSSFHELSEIRFTCKNTSFIVIYYDKNKDGKLDNGDHFVVLGQTEGCVMKLIHVTGKSIAEISF